MPVIYINAPIDDVTFDDIEFVLRTFRKQLSEEEWISTGLEIWSNGSQTAFITPGVTLPEEFYRVLPATNGE